MRPKHRGATGRAKRNTVRKPARSPGASARTTGARSAAKPRPAQRASSAPPREPAPATNGRGNGGGNGRTRGTAPARTTAAAPAASAAERAREFAALLREVPFQFSGRYEYNGGASARQGRSFVDTVSGHSRAALENPIYDLRAPVFIDDPGHDAAARRRGDEIRFTIHVDVDGPDPLGVVSGRLAKGHTTVGAATPHFIGRVTRNEPSGNRRTLVVENFSFRWPDSMSRINRLDIRLTGSPLVPATAEVVFRDTLRRRRYGPYSVVQASTFFRHVEVDMDNEAGSVEVEPSRTHTHPDRPADVADEEMTLESVFARAGIEITRSPGSGTVVEAREEAGADRRWNYAELHDSMQLHWDAFANKPQWKMWLFLANRADDDSLGGVMFDGEIDEPGGVDRQGTALFTRCPYFHTVTGGYPRANPPAGEAVRRELFFNLIHETGHAFNLAHSFDKRLVGGPGEGAWRPPPWMPVRSSKQALSWMNYPDAATPGGNAGANATWFYQRFRFRFDEPELLFLRHAPESYVEMGNADWFQNHGRAARSAIDRRLELRLRSRKRIVEYGEPVILELRLGLRAGVEQPVAAHANLDPSDGLVEVAVTNPRGERRPFLPIAHTRTRLRPEVLEQGKRIYEMLDMSVGQFGFPFKEPGAYRIEATYANFDGGMAADVMQLYVRPPAQYDDLPIIHRLFNARVGRVLYVGGTRTMDDVENTLAEVTRALDDQRPSAGRENPVTYHLRATLAMPRAAESKIVDPRSSEIKTIAADPDAVVAELEPVVADADAGAAAADSMGHIWYRQLVDSFAQAAVQANKRPVGRDAQRQLLAMFKEREVVPAVIAAVEQRVRELA
ncbi:MAG: hypothetical protein ABR499_16205 [Gemmatimonadaceae bacterium]